MPKYRSIVALMVGLVITAIVATLGTSAALAQVPPPDPALPSALPTGAGGGNPMAMVSHPGSPIWVFVLVAALTMLVTAVVTYVATGRRRLSEQLI
jgi:hypothetical protein